MFPPKKTAVPPAVRKPSAEMQLAQAQALRGRKPKPKRSSSGEFPAVQDAEK